VERKYVKDYEVREDGSLNYTGALYRAVITDKHRTGAVITAAACAVLYAGVLFTGNIVTRWWASGVPLLLMAVTVPLYCLNAVRFRKLAVPMERRFYDGTFMHIGIYALANAVLAGAAAVLCAVLLVRTPGPGMREYAVPLLCAAVSAVSFRFFNGWRQLQRSVDKE
jgi:hypothetical protein